MVDVVIVDDQPFFRSSARAVVSALPGFCTVAEASSGAEAVAVVDRLHPDLVVLDVRMPGMDGIRAAREIKAHLPQTVVILLSVEDQMPSSGRGCGADAFVRKRDFAPALLRALWASHGAP